MLHPSFEIHICSLGLRFFSFVLIQSLFIFASYGTSKYWGFGVESYTLLYPAKPLLPVTKRRFRGYKRSSRDGQGCIVRISTLIFRKLSRVTRSLFMRVRHKIEENILLLYHFRWYGRKHSGLSRVVWSRGSLAGLFRVQRLLRGSDSWVLTASLLSYLGMRLVTWDESRRQERNSEESEFKDCLLHSVHPYGVLYRRATYTFLEILIEP